MKKNKVYQNQVHKGKFSAIHKLLCKYDQYLDHERGLAELVGENWTGF